MRRSSVAGYSAAGDYWATAGIAVDSGAEVGRISGYSAGRNSWVAIIGAADSPATVIARIVYYGAVDNRRAACTTKYSTST